MGLSSVDGSLLDSRRGLDLAVWRYWNYRQFQERQQFDEGTPLGTQKFWSDDLGGDIAFTSTRDLFNEHNRFTVGFVPTVEFESDSWYANTNGSNGPLLEADWTAATNFALYAENQHYVRDRLSVLTGLQAVAVGREFVSPQMGNHYYALNPKLGGSNRTTLKSCRDENGKG